MEDELNPAGTQDHSSQSHLLSRPHSLCGAAQDEEQLSEMFAKYGEVRHLQLTRRLEDNSSKGIAFVKYAKRAEALAAINELHGFVGTPPCQCLQFAGRASVVYAEVPSVRREAEAGRQHGLGSAGTRLGLSPLKGRASHPGLHGSQKPLVVRLAVEKVATDMPSPPPPPPQSGQSYTNSLYQAPTPYGQYQQMPPTGWMPQHMPQHMQQIQHMQMGPSASQKRRVCGRSG